MTNTAGSAREPKNEVRGTVLAVLRELLASGHDDEALAVVAKLVSRNEELERMLAKMRESKNKKEGISREQLDLFIDHLKKATDGVLDEASQKLEDATKQNGGAPPKTKPLPQPPVRRPPPPNARRVENPIAVPAEQRPCPKCGGDKVVPGGAYGARLVSKLVRRAGLVRARPRTSRRQAPRADRAAR